MEAHQRRENDGYPSGGVYRYAAWGPLWTHIRVAHNRGVAEEGLEKDISIYSLRHTYATTLLRSHVDIRTVQKLLGHSDISTTMEYLDYVDPEKHPTDQLPY